MPEVPDSEADNPPERVVHSLTRDEATRRAELIAVQRYDIDVDVTSLLDGEEWRATSTVRFSCREPGAGTFVDCVADVASATLNGVPVPADAISEGRIRLDGLASDNVLVVSSTQRETSASAGIQRTVDPRDGEVYVWTTFEPDDARRAWACFDQPDLKAPHRFRVLAPSGWLVTSNRRPESVEAAGTARRWIFPDTPVLSPYVVVINAGPFHHLHSTRDGRDLGLYCRRSLAAFLDRDAEELFALTAAGLAFFGEQFGRPFEQDSYDHVFVPDMAGAMENWGCVTWSDTALHRSPPTHRERSHRAEVLMHEMAHMWFGDLVTMRWWDDLWLNESFAEWASSWACTRVTEFVETWTTFLAFEKRLGYRNDMSGATHPIRQQSRDVAEAAARFDAITYVKGSSVLKQLVAYVGEDAFVTGLRSYFTEHAWGNTTLDDLIRALEAVSGRDLSRWTPAWLDRAGTDRIELEQTADGWRLRATAPDGGPPRPHRLDVGVYQPNPEGPMRRLDLLPVEVEDEITEVALDGGGGAAGERLLLVNDEDLTFASSRPDQQSRALMLARAGELPTSMARAVATATAWDMLAYGEATAAEYLSCAGGALRTETVSAVVQAELGPVLTAAEYWTAAGERERILADVAELATELAGRPDVRDAALRTLARTAATQQQLGLVAEAAEDDPSIGWLLQARLAELGRIDEPAIRALEERDPDPDAWVSALAARTAAPDIQAKEAAWQSVFVDNRVPSDRIQQIGTAFWRPGQADLLADYPQRYLDALPRLGGGLLTLAYVCRVFFPYLADASFADAVDELIARDDVNPTVTLVLRERNDTLRRMLRSRGEAAARS